MKHSTETKVLISEKEQKNTKEKTREIDRERKKIMDPECLNKKYLTILIHEKLES